MAKTLFERLKPEFAEILSTRDGGALGRKAKEYLQRENFYLDLTFSEMDTICEVIYNKGFTQTRQIQELFTHDEEY